MTDLVTRPGRAVALPDDVGAAADRFTRRMLRDSP